MKIGYKLYYKVRNYPNRIYRLNSGFKWYQRRLKIGFSYKFIRNMHSPIKYKAKYYMKK